MKFPHKCSGFTLLELLIAISVFTILALAAYGGLDSILETREGTALQAARLDALQRTFVQMSVDLEQLIDRPVRDELGGVRPALIAGGSDAAQLEFTRTGWPNPTGLARSHLQRVTYYLRDGRFTRLHWYDLDRAPGAAVKERSLLDDVDRVELRFLDAKRDWHDQWPPISAIGTPQETGFPLAVEVTLELADWGEITRLFAVPR